MNKLKNTTKKQRISAVITAVFLLLFLALGISVTTQENGEKEVVYTYPSAIGGGGQTVFAQASYPVADEPILPEQDAQSYPVADEADWTEAPELTDPNHMATDQEFDPSALPFDPELCETIQGPPCTLVRMPADWQPPAGQEIKNLTDYLDNPNLADTIVGNSITDTDYQTWLQSQGITPETYNQWAHDTLGYEIPTETQSGGIGGGGTVNSGGGAPPNDGTVFLWTDTATGGGNPNGTDLNAGGGTNLGGGNPDGSDPQAGGGGGSDYAPNYEADIANGIYGGNPNGTDSSAGGGNP